MAELSRLNGIIQALEEGSVAFVGSAPADGAAGTNAPYDGALFEMEHGPYDIRALQEGLQGMLDRTQFILITHNRRTMEIANRLYGVTMEEPGVSKLISVQLN